MKTTWDDMDCLWNEKRSVWGDGFYKWKSCSLYFVLCFGDKEDKNCFISYWNSSKWLITVWCYVDFFECIIYMYSDKDYSLY